MDGRDGDENKREETQKRIAASPQFQLEKRHQPS
jgi:hypothetical protein